MKKLLIVGAIGLAMLYIVYPRSQPDPLAKLPPDWREKIKKSETTAMRDWHSPIGQEARRHCSVSLDLPLSTETMDDIDPSLGSAVMLAWTDCVVKRMYPKQ